jgi:hypothetical protein
MSACMARQGFALSGAFENPNVILPKGCLRLA